MMCPKCKIEMTDGFSLDGTDSAVDTTLRVAGATPSNAATLRLTPVLKCPSCGYSIRTCSTTKSLPQPRSA
jgi:predicted Zn-ribbon and HTH transcriptional regulator